MLLAFLAGFIAAFALSAVVVIVLIRQAKPGYEDEQTGFHNGVKEG